MKNWNDLTIEEKLQEAAIFINETINPQVIEKNNPYKIDEILFKEFKEAINNGDEVEVEKIKYACKYLEHCEFVRDDYNTGHSPHNYKGFQLFKTNENYYGYARKVPFQEIVDDVEKNGIDGPYNFSFVFANRDHYQHGIIRGHIEFDLEESSEGEAYIDRIDVLNSYMFRNAFRRFFKADIEEMDNIYNQLNDIYKKYSNGNDDVYYKIDNPSDTKFAEHIVFERFERKEFDANSKNIFNKFITTSFDINCITGEVKKSIDGKEVETFMDKDMIFDKEKAKEVGLVDLMANLAVQEKVPLPGLD